MVISDHQNQTELPQPSSGLVALSIERTIDFALNVPMDEPLEKVGASSD